MNLLPSQALCLRRFSVLQGNLFPAEQNVLRDAHPHGAAGYDREEIGSFAFADQKL